MSPSLQTHPKLPAPVPPLSPGGALSVRILTHPEEIATLQDGWQKLFASAPQATPALSYDWMRAWCQFYAPAYAPGGLAVLTACRADQLVGLLPLYLNRPNPAPLHLRRLSFLSTGESEFEETCPDYLNVLAAAPDLPAVLAAFASALARFPADLIEFKNIPADSPLCDPAFAPTASRQTLLPDQCPIANISGGFSAYLARLNHKHRNLANRCLRQALQAGASMTIASPNQIDEFFDALVAIHQDRWTAVGKPGVFASPRFTAFHRDLAHTLIPAGRAVLARLSTPTQPLAVIYGFLENHKFDAYQCGVTQSPTAPLPSPGMSAHLLLIQQLADRGVLDYDFLRGRCQYKSSLATGYRPLLTLHLWRPTLRAAAYRTLRFLCRLHSPARPSRVIHN